MIPELLKEAEDKMKRAVEATRHEFSNIRTGRANPGILDNLRVEAYGQLVSLNQLGTVSVPEPRQLLITAFDRTMYGAIEKAIMKSDVGITPNNDGNGIRLNIPALTEQRRKDLIKQMHTKSEAGKVSCRNIRQDAVKRLQTQKKAKENPISENEEKRATDQVQKLVDKYTAEVDALAKAKEAELLEV